MQCVGCRRDISDDAAYCPACGAFQQASSDVPWRSRRLTRSRTDVKIAGVCGGIAEYFGVDATIVRVLWVILSIVPGGIIGGVLAYLVTWLVMPEPSAPAVGFTPRTRLRRSATDRKVAGVCGGIAEYFGVDATPLRLLWILLSVLPGAIVGGIVVYVAAWIVMPRAPDAGPALSPTPTT
jgi:phage shock protein PspC (stress-responsive transcriptional regulator)